MLVDLRRSLSAVTTIWPVGPARPASRWPSANEMPTAGIVTSGGVGWPSWAVSPSVPANTSVRPVVPWFMMIAPRRRRVWAFVTLSANAQVPRCISAIGAGRKPVKSLAWQPEFEAAGSASLRSTRADRPRAVAAGGVAHGDELGVRRVGLAARDQRRIGGLLEGDEVEDLRRRGVARVAELVEDVSHRGAVARKPEARLPPFSSAIIWSACRCLNMPSALIAERSFARCCGRRRNCRPCGLARLGGRGGGPCLGDGRKAQRESRAYERRRACEQTYGAGPSQGRCWGDQPRHAAGATGRPRCAPS